MPEYDDEDAGPQRPAEELRRVARYQRWVVGTALAQLGLWAGFVLLSSREFAYGLDFPGLVTIAIGCAGGIFAFLIYCTVRDPFMGLVMGAASAVPVMGLLALTVVNGVATRELTRNGVAVGWFGANPDAIAEWHELADEDADW